MRGTVAAPRRRELVEDECPLYTGRMMSSSEGSGPNPDLFRASIAAIDAEHPLRSPWHYDQSVTGPRLDRLDAKTAYFVDYIQYLEQRLAALEARLAQG